MTAPLPLHAVLIDLDGTLLDTALDLAAAANAMLREIGRPEVPTETIRNYIGRGVPNLVKRCLTGRMDAADDPAPPPAVALEVFEKCYHESNGRYSAVYPGVLEGIEAFKAKGLKLACLTNKAEAFTFPLLERTELLQHFDVVVCGDTLPRHKPDPMQLTWVCGHFDIRPHQMLLCGDSLNDAKAARAAGCPVFIVPYGYNEGQDVRGLDCDAIVGSLLEAAQLVTRA
ncbi:MAG: phosphoglycolate phosphatase [Gammaproteobacteria bacterium]|nr:phosphoglycolate phosphatase [Gammaproteobacteria bacterium]MBU1645984.1 phosphoglycolate phosphatase [Gammaproteobacteria bacterium]MBU1972046.1 phosphoglycolate phosphatase [Gammaproteobacteria bacterium]